MSKVGGSVFMKFTILGIHEVHYNIVNFMNTEPPTFDMVSLPLYFHYTYILKFATTKFWGGSAPPY